MDDKLYKLIIQGLTLISVTILAVLKILDGESITWIFGIIIGYVFGIAKTTIKTGSGKDEK